MKWTVDDCGRWRLENALCIPVRLSLHTRADGYDRDGWRLILGEVKTYLSVLLTEGDAKKATLMRLSLMLRTMDSEIMAMDGEIVRFYPAIKPEGSR